jgi:hypothetical protein
MNAVGKEQWGHSSSYTCGTQNTSFYIKGQNIVYKVNFLCCSICFVFIQMEESRFQKNVCPWNEVLHCELPEDTVTEIVSYVATKSTSVIF